MERNDSRGVGRSAPTTVTGSTSEARGQSSQVGTPALGRAINTMYSVLSPKEQAVVLAAALGTEDKEIASELDCTLSTVRTLWQRIYRKTHTTSKRRLISAIWSEACRAASSSRVIF